MRARARRGLARALRIAVGVFALSGATGCLRDAYKPVEGKSFDAAIFYAEQGGDRWDYHSSRGRGTGAPAERPSPATRLPCPAQVDVDGRIHIYVDRGRVALEEGGRELEGHFERLRSQREKAEKVLRGIEELVKMRGEAIDAYAAGSSDFAEAKEAFGIAEDALIGTLMTEYAGDIEALELAAQDPAGTYPGLARWFEGKIAEIEAGERALEDSVRAEAVSLRLEAWIVRESGPVPVHLPGYDTLEEGRLRLSDRFGLDLSPKQREELESELAASRAFAERANRVLAGEEKLLDALTGVLSEDLAATVEEIRALVARWNPAALRARLDELERSGADFFAALGARAATLSAEGRAELEALPAELRTWLGQESTAVRGVLATVSRADELRTRWSDASGEQIPALILDTQAFITELAGLDAVALASEAGGDVGTFLTGKAAGWQADARASLEGLVASDEGRAFIAEVGKARADFAEITRTCEGIVERLQPVLDEVDRQQVTLTTVPESLEVPFEEIRDTELDLRRTDREEGDGITIRATRSKGGEARESSTAEFIARRFGWYAELSPAVVLAKPDQLTGDDDGFRFAPTLSWLHYYVPRPGSTAGDFVNAFQPSLGVHAAFLSFDGDDTDAIQVGLGATASLWNGRLQAGAGYNLMAESREDGQWYYFIGTDLIGLLQTAGIVSP